MLKMGENVCAFGNSLARKFSANNYMQAWGQTPNRAWTINRSFIATLFQYSRRDPLAIPQRAVFRW